MNKRTLVVLALALGGCRAVLNYPSALGPRYAGLPTVPSPAAPASHSLRVVTYNVQWGKYVDRAINVLKTRAPLAGADIIVLQEMDAAGTQRIATVVTVMVGTVRVRVYSAHLGTPSDIRPAKRRDQADMIMADAAPYPLVIVAGDMNSHGIGKEFVEQGFVWPTEHNGFTTAVFNWDHVFLKGFAIPAPDQKSAGIVRDTLGTSDHDPVWAVAQLP